MKASVTVINQGSENGININFYAYELLSSRTRSYRTPKFFHAYVGAYDISWEGPQSSNKIWPVYMIL